MSRQQEQDMTDSKTKIITGYIYYDEKTDDVSKLFDILNSFRKNNGLKYSHQSKESIVFFNINTKHLDALSKVRPYQISKFQSKTEYTCDKNTSEQLMKQKDSFLRMLWDDSRNVLVFLSRTPTRIHNNLVRRIFKDSNVEFNRDNYVNLKKSSNKFYHQDHQNHQDHQDHQDQVHTQTQSQSLDGFQRVESKKNKKFAQQTQTSQTLKVIKDTSHSHSQSQPKPKVRGTKTFTAKTNV